jgi:hypothetical protein
MLIHERNNFVEIFATDRVEDEQTPGDTRLVITFSSHGFRGQGSAWVEARCLAEFVQQLRVLEVKRQGAAELESMSPGALRVCIWSVDRRGHVAVSGRVSRSVPGYDGSDSYRHLVEFGFEFDPTLLPGVVAGFQAILEGRGEERT